MRELPVIQKIIQDETWLEGERRGGYVASNDPVVQAHVCDVVLRIGEQLRETLRVDEVLQAVPIEISDRSKAA